MMNNDLLKELNNDLNNRNTIRTTEPSHNDTSLIVRRLKKFTICSMRMAKIFYSKFNSVDEMENYVKDFIKKFYNNSSNKL